MSPLPQPVELPVDERTSALPLRTQLVRFVLTGGLSAVVDFGLLVILMALGLSHTPAKSISFVAGTTTAPQSNASSMTIAHTSGSTCSSTLMTHGAPTKSRPSRASAVARAASAPGEGTGSSA